MFQPRHYWVANDGLRSRHVLIRYENALESYKKRLHFPLLKVFLRWHLCKSPCVDFL